MQNKMIQNSIPAISSVAAIQEYEGQYTPNIINQTSCKWQSCSSFKYLIKYSPIYEASYIIILN